MTILGLLVSAMLLAACSSGDTSQQVVRKSSAQDPAQIQFKQPLHFVTPDGSDLVVQKEPIVSRRLMTHNFGSTRRSVLRRS